VTRFSATRQKTQDIKQQLAKKEGEKERKERKIEELVAKRGGLESELRKAKPEERQDIEAAIKNVKEDIDSLRGEIPALNEQIKFLLGEWDFFFSFFISWWRLRNSCHLFLLFSFPTQVRAKQFAYGHSNLQQPREFSAYPEAGINLFPLSFLISLLFLFSFSFSFSLPVQGGDGGLWIIFLSFLRSKPGQWCICISFIVILLFLLRFLM